MGNYITIKAQKLPGFLLRAGILVFLLAGLIVHEASAQDNIAGVATEYLQNGENVNLEKVRISVEFDNTRLDEAILQLGEKGGVTVNYNAKLLPGEAKVTYQSRNATLAEILDSILPSNVSYLAVRDIVILRKKEKPEINPEDYFQETITGTVSEATTGETLPGVNIMVKGTTIGTSTDQDGNYDLEVPSLQDTLEFSFIGYQSQEVPINGRTEIDIALQTQAIAGDELVVVGYGEVRRSNLTSTITSVSSDRIGRTPTSNAMEALQGSVPGMDIVRSSGKPGASMNITIRGNRSLAADNSPLFIVDGVQYNDINDLNPSDIESIEVLRDASSTAIYGSRGANGVILISTKQGERGQTQVTVSSNVGFHDVSEMPRNQTAAEYVERRREYARTENRWNGPVDRIDEFTVLPGDENVFNLGLLDGIENGISTNYLDMLISSRQVQQDHRIGISVGTESNRVHLSLNQYDEKGILPKDHLKRYSGRLNIDQKISDAFTVGLNSQFTHTSFDRMNDTYLFGLAYKIPPLHDPYREDGSLRMDLDEVGVKHSNPLVDLQPNAYVNNEKITTFFPTLYAELNPAQNLSLRSSLSATLRNTPEGAYRAPWSAAGQTTSINEVQSGYYNSYHRKYSVKNIATYEMELSEHALTFTGIQEYRFTSDEFSNLEGNGQLLDSQIYYNLSAATNDIRINSGYTESSLASYAGRVQYDWKDKYLLTLTGRYDGSSRLAEGEKWAFFPSAAFAWRVLEEDFMNNSGVLSDLKFRISYGVSGNQAIDPYSTQSRLVMIPMAFDNRSFTGFGFDSQLGNPNLGWELSNTTNIGLDIGLLDNRFNASLDVYNTYTSDLLLNRSLPISSGALSILQNVGDTRNSGVELALNSVNIETDRFRWSSNLTWFANREEIVSLVTKDDNVADGWFIGEPISAIYEYEYAGIWQEDEAAEAASYGQEPGEIRVKDQDNSGDISESDRIILGSRSPDWSGGLENTFNYGNFDLSFSFFARVGQMLSNSHSSQAFRNEQENKAYVDYWTPENPDGRFPRPGIGERYSSAIVYEDASYLKLRTATLGYELPADITQSLAMRSLRVYVSGRNLYTWTGVDHVDPEGGGSLYQPLTRYLSAGIDLQF